MRKHIDITHTHARVHIHYAALWYLLMIPYMDDLVVTIVADILV